MARNDIPNGWDKIRQNVQETDTANLEQIFHLCTSSQESVCNTVDQSCVFMEQNVSCFFIPLVRTPDQGNGIPGHFLPADDFFHVYDSSFIWFRFH